MGRVHSVSRAALVLLLVPDAIARQCFWPNGDEHANGIPCDPKTTGHVACCESTHTCLATGLCFDTFFNHVVRVSCTDASWDSDDCPQFCTTKPGTTDKSDFFGDMRQCDGGNNDWVCGQNVSDCSKPIKAPDRSFIEDFRPLTENNIIAAGPSENNKSSSSSSSSSSSTASEAAAGATTVTATPTANPTVTAAPQKSNGPSATAAGVAAGLGVGIPLLIALAVMAFLLFKAKRELARLKGAPNHGSTVGMVGPRTNSYGSPLSSPGGIGAVPLSAIKQAQAHTDAMSHVEPYGGLTSPAQTYGPGQVPQQMPPQSQQPLSAGGYGSSTYATSRYTGYTGYAPPGNDRIELGGNRELYEAPDDNTVGDPSKHPGPFAF